MDVVEVAPGDVVLRGVVGTSEEPSKADVGVPETVAERVIDGMLGEDAGTDVDGAGVVGGALGAGETVPDGTPAGP